MFRRGTTTSVESGKCLRRLLTGGFFLLFCPEIYLLFSRWLFWTFFLITTVSTLLFLVILPYRLAFLIIRSFRCSTIFRCRYISNLLFVAATVVNLKYKNKLNTCLLKFLLQPPWEILLSLISVREQLSQIIRCQVETNFISCL